MAREGRFFIVFVLLLFCADLAQANCRPSCKTKTSTKASTILKNCSTRPVSKSCESKKDPHEKLFEKTRFPSATTCKTCHPRQFEQWSVSQHAYAQLSPVFMAMQNTTNREQSGTSGDFCIRCHTPIGMQLKESVYTSNLKRSAIAREGVTCVVCHRVKYNYGKVSGRIRLEEGELTDPVYGPTGNQELKRVLASKNEYKVETDPKEKGRKIHRRVNKFFALTEPKFCGTCHDVTVVNGFRFEEAFSEYRHSPAAKCGHKCQDCHMGVTPGKPCGFDYGAAAKIGEKSTKVRRISNHYFAGPDYSIIHPGLFPINPEAQELATPEQWLKFDYQAGWGTEAFEKQVSKTAKFPKHWDTADARYDAREILDEQYKLLKWAKGQRQKLLTAAYQIRGFQVLKSAPDHLKFRIKVVNATNGHNAPTGFIAERLVFLQVNVYDRAHHLIYQSGNRDPNGDVRDLHSLYVRAGLISKDKDLLSLQSKFINRNVRGGERESILAVNRSFDPRPLVRPSNFPAIINGSPRNGRIQREGIPPESGRWAKYNVPACALLEHPGPYRVSVKLIAQMVPVNLIARIEKVGFDYHMSSQEIAKLIVKHSHVLATKHYSINTITNDRA